MRCSALRWPITGSTADLRRNWRLMLGVTLADFLRLGLFSIVDKQWCGQSQRKTASVIVTLLETPQLSRAIAYRLDRGRVRGRQLDLLFGTDPNMSVVRLANSELLDLKSALLSGRSTLKAAGEGQPDRKHGPHDQL